MRKPNGANDIIILSLLASGFSMTSKDLQSITGISKSHLGDKIVQFCDSGYIEYMASESDGTRSRPPREYSITEDGHARLDAIMTEFLVRRF